jgi:hypothetical protein
VLASCNGLKISALVLTRYLSNHFTYWSGGDSGHPRYPRALLRVVLNRQLKHAGIRFPRPPEADGPGAAASAAAAFEPLQDSA